MRDLELSKGRYRIRESLVLGVATNELEQLHSELLQSLRSAYQQRQAVIKKLEETCCLPTERVEERFALVDEYLSQLAGNRGEAFRSGFVRSFARIFSHVWFLTSAVLNDSCQRWWNGFCGGRCNLPGDDGRELNKVRKDLAKAPGTMRVLVRPTITSRGSKVVRKNDVLETIELKDLLGHFIGWLFRTRQPRQEVKTPSASTRNSARRISPRE